MIFDINSRHKSSSKSVEKIQKRNETLLNMFDDNWENEISTSYIPSSNEQQPVDSNDTSLDNVDESQESEEPPDLDVKFYQDFQLARKQLERKLNFEEKKAASTKSSKHFYYLVPRRKSPPKVSYSHSLRPEKPIWPSPHKNQHPPLTKVSELGPKHLAPKQTFTNYPRKTAPLEQSSSEII